MLAPSLDATLFAEVTRSWQLLTPVRSQKGLLRL